MENEARRREKLEKASPKERDDIEKMKLLKDNLLKHMMLKRVVIALLI